MLFYTRRLAALLCFSVKTIALGINCRGSGLCPRASFLNNNDASIIQTLRDVVHATSLPDTTVYNSGDHVVCVSQSTKITISPTFQGEIDGFSAGASIGLSGSINSGGICLFPQGASLTLGSIKPLTDAILDHKCTTCGSVPIHFVDQGSNDPGAGILTFNYVAAPTCDRNCIRSLGSPDSGMSPSSQPAQQPSGTPLQQPQQPSNTPAQQPQQPSDTPVQQPTTQASVTPVTTQPRVTEPLTVIQQPFTSASEPEPVTIIQTPSSAPSDSSSSSGSGGGGGSAASGSNDDTGSSADSGGGGAATTQAVNSATQQVVTVVSAQTSDQQGSAVSTTQGGDQDAGAAAAGPSTVTVAPGSSTAAAGGGVVTVTGGSAATPSGNAGTSGQGATGSASPSSGLGVPGSARMADAVWLYIVIPMAALF